MSYFFGCCDEASYRAKYKELVKKHHPDKGGDVKVMQEINAEFDTLKKNNFSALSGASAGSAFYSRRDYKQKPFGFSDLFESIRRAEEAQRRKAAHKPKFGGGGGFNFDGFAGFNSFNSSFTADAEDNPYDYELDDDGNMITKKEARRRKEEKAEELAAQMKRQEQDRKEKEYRARVADVDKYLETFQGLTYQEIFMKLQADFYDGKIQVCK